MNFSHVLMTNHVSLAEYINRGGRILPFGALSTVCLAHQQAHWMGEANVTGTHQRIRAKGVGCDHPR